MSHANRHDFVPYHQSLTAELKAIKDRVRQLVKHWPTDGHFKEAILRQVLRRYLPESVLIGTGFVVNYFGPSGEIDVLIVDRSLPTLFKEGELLIVTPESVRAIIEVKTRLRTNKEITNAVSQLAECKAVAQSHAERKNVWAGLFVYQGGRERHADILNALGQVHRGKDTCIDVVAFGEDTLVKFFPVPVDKGGVHPANAWHSFDVPGVAAANFVASLIEALVPPTVDPGTFAWFMLPKGSKPRYFLLEKTGAEPEPFDS